MAIKPLIGRWGQGFIMQQQRLLLLGKKTFYVRPSGGTYGTEDGTSYENAWDGFSNIEWSKVSGNTLAICGTHTEALTVGASNVTIIGNDPNEAGIINATGLGVGCLVVDLSNVTINNLTISNASISNLQFGTNNGGNIQSGTTNNLVLSNSGNQSIQHYGKSTVTHNNCIATNNTDDGISVHDEGNVTVNGGTFTDNSEGIAFISTSNVTINGPITFSSNTTNDITFRSAGVCVANDITTTSKIELDGGGTYTINRSTIEDIQVDSGNTVTINNSTLNKTTPSSFGKAIMNNCIIKVGGLIRLLDVEIYKSRITNVIDVNGVFKCRHTLIQKQIDFQSGSNCDIKYCVFNGLFGGSSNWALVLRTGATLTKFNNNTINGDGLSSRGIFTQFSITVNNLILTNLDVVDSSSLITYNNSCFYNNNNTPNGTDNNSQTGNPKLSDPANLNFALGAGSSCIGTGTTLTEATGIASADWGNGTTETPAVTTKEQGINWDIGAYIS